MRRSIPCKLVVTVALAALGLAGCDNTIDDTGFTTPTPPAPTLTETFSGTLTKNGSITHPFITVASGTVTATLTSVAPDNTLPIGLDLGTWNGQNCLVVLTNSGAIQGNVLTGNVTGSGTLCIRVSDAGGKIVDTLDYSVDVVHP